MECHDGQAWVGIRVQLGYEAGLQIPIRRNKNTPSRQRRRARRAAARGEQDQNTEEALGPDHHLAELARENGQQDQKEAAKAGKKEVVTEHVDDESRSNTEYSENESREVFSFKSFAAEENIEKCLDEIRKNTNIASAKIILRDQLSGSVYLYTLELRIVKGKHGNASFSWPEMSSSEKDVFINLKRIF